MRETGARPRVFEAGAETAATTRLGEHRIVITPAVEASEGGLLSAYSARFARGERAELPAPYEEVWVVVSGMLRLRGPEAVTTAGPGHLVHVPKDSPGQVEAVEDTVLVSVSVPPH